MPLYEYHCLSCDLIFEELSALSEASKKRPCPECGKRAPRIVSAFAITSGGNGDQQEPAATLPNQPRDPRPVCMRYPQIPLSCHMDEFSVQRFAAHTAGRGNEFDDKVGQAAELRKKRGLPEPQYAPPAHNHDHDHHFRRHAKNREQGHNHTHGDHGHSHGQSQNRGKGKTLTHTHGTH